MMWTEVSFWVAISIIINGVFTVVSMHSIVTKVVMMGGVIVVVKNITVFKTMVAVVVVDVMTLVSVIINSMMV